MQNKCFNCAYFMSCKKADPYVQNCDYFKPTEIKLKGYKH